MHFIGHIKKRKSSELEDGGGADSPSPPAAKKRQKGSPLDAVGEEAKENVAAAAAAPSSDTVMKCHSCDIGFSQLSNFLAHKKYYCRGLQSSSPNPPPPSLSTYFLSYNMHK